MVIEGAGLAKLPALADLQIYIAAFPVSDLQQVWRSRSLASLLLCGDEGLYATYLGEAAVAVSCMLQTLLV